MKEFIPLIAAFLGMGLITFLIYLILDKFRLKRTIKLVPIFLTVILIIWTIIVSPHSEYGDNWAIDPIVSYFPLVFWWHVFICIKGEQKIIERVLYFVFNVAIFFAVWIYCAMFISKDSL